MSNCKTCNQEILWDQKRREALKIRGPINLDGTMHQCLKNSEGTKEDKIIAALENLTQSVNALVFGLVASTEQERNAVRGMIVK